MDFKFGLLLFLICILNVNCENNTWLKDRTYHDYLKTKFGCIPPQNWDLIELDGTRNIINNVCLEKEYQVNDAPHKTQSTEVMVTFTDKRVLNVDEKSKVVTVDIKMLTIWGDERIKYMLQNDSDIQLPDITKDFTAIWHPFISFVIVGLKELKFIFDPIIAKEVRLVSAERVNRFMHAQILEPGEVKVLGIFKWIVEVSCDMEFLDYPFDQHTCPLVIIAENINVTLLDFPNPQDYSHDHWTNHLNKFQKESKGFTLGHFPMIIESSYSPLYDHDVTPFGFNVTMERQLQPYIYQYYIPCIVIVSTSFLSFIISFTSIPARVSLIVTLFLTLTNMCIYEMVSDKTRRG